MKRRSIYILTAVLLTALFACLQINAADYIRGDIDNNAAVDSKDAIYLLRHVLDEDRYAVTQNVDLNRDGTVSTDDAIYLLRHTTFSDSYPIGCDILGHIYSDSKCKYCGETSEGIDISKFSSNANYNYLGTLSNGADMQAFYNALDNSMTKFHTDTAIDAQVLTQETDTWYTVAYTNYSNLGLTTEQAFQVWKGYRDDHPLYYWLIDFVYSPEEIITITCSDYIDGDDRANCNEQIYKAIDEYISGASEETSSYAIAAVYFDDIINGCSYKTFDGEKTYAELYRECTIVGPLLDKNAFNSGYAKLYQLLLNYEGIENWFAWNEAPEFLAWNLVKLDDGNWYWYDLAQADNQAWDAWDTYLYFCQTLSTLPDDHNAFVADYSPVAPDLSDTAFSVEGIVEINSNFVVDSVRYKLLNSNREVMVVSHNFDTVDNVTETITYRDIVYTVVDVVNNDNDVFNMALYESTNCYDYLGTLSNGDALKKLYEEFDVKFTMFHLGKFNNVNTEVINSNTYYEIAKIDYAKYGLTFNDAIKVMCFYRYDHPLYYWSHYGWVYNTGTGHIYPCTVADYDTWAERQGANSKVYNGVRAYTDLAEGETDPYLLTLCYYDAIINSCEYAYNSSGNPESALWAHSIMGAFSKKSFVCEGYAKLLHLVLNYHKVENMYITGQTDGGGHAWNLVKLDDEKWYWCDSTWGDGNDFFKYFCTTDSVLLSTHTPDPITNSSAPYDVIPSLPTRSTAAYSNNNILKLMDQFTIDGRTYRVVGYRKVECIVGSGQGEVLPDAVTYNGEQYTVVVHVINNAFWYNDNVVYNGYCCACDAWVNMYEVEDKALELTFEENILDEVSKYNGFSVVSPQNFNIVSDSNGNGVLSCGSSTLYIDVDRQILADLKTFAITFDLKITKNGNAGQEISILSLLSNHQNGSQISGKSVGWGWFFKYNVNEKKFETIKVSDETSKLTSYNSVSMSLNTTYKVTVFVDTIARKSYVVIDGTPIGMTYRDTWYLPDLSLSEYDNALSIRFNDGGNCAPVYDNFKIVAIN